MKRNINIISDSYRHIADGYDTVNLSQIEDIVDCSVDTILYYNISYLNKPEAKQALGVLSRKLRLGGSVVIKFTNLDLLCKNYLNRKISTTEFLENVQEVSNGLSIDEIYTYIDGDSLRITKVGKEKNNISVAITRVKI